MKVKANFLRLSGFLALTLVVTSAPHTRAQEQKPLPPIPAQVNYATEFVQQLNDLGLKVERVALSKFNGGYFGPTKAAYIKTEQGAFEVVFFDRAADLDAIQIREEETGIPNYHRYRITLVDKTLAMEGRLPVFLIKYRDMLIVTYDSSLNKALKDLLH